MNKDVTAFLDDQNHPLRKEIEELRACILAANPNLSENIKWNSPNYCFNGDDRITMKIQPPKSIQIILHRGAKKQEQPKGRIINNPPYWLVWKENDRAIATFKDGDAIESCKSGLTSVISQWIEATK